MQTKLLELSRAELTKQLAAALLRARRAELERDVLKPLLPEIEYPWSTL